VGEDDSHNTRSCIEFIAEPGRTYAIDPWGSCEITKPSRPSGGEIEQLIVCKASLVNLDAQRQVDARFYKQCGKEFYLKGSL